MEFPVNPTPKNGAKMMNETLRVYYKTVRTLERLMGQITINETLETILNRRAAKQRSNTYARVFIILLNSDYYAVTNNATQADRADGTLEKKFLTEIMIEAKSLS